MLILMVFIISYGIAVQVILYPNEDAEWGLVRSIMRKAYYQIYGEMFFGEIEGKMLTYL